MAVMPKIDDRERRATAVRLEVRGGAAESTVRTTTGYAALFDNEVNIGGYWRERIAPGAFTRSLSENDVVALNSHESARVVGRSSAGTLTLKQDSKGLAFENDLPDTTDGRDLSVLIERGDVAAMSFGFITRKQEWDETVEPPLRTIIEADILEITYTAFPAYPDTSVGLRSLEHFRTEHTDPGPEARTARNAARRARLAHRERNID